MGKKKNKKKKKKKKKKKEKEKKKKKRKKKMHSTMVETDNDTILLIPDQITVTKNAAQRMYNKDTIR